MKRGDGKNKTSEPRRARRGPRGSQINAKRFPKKTAFDVVT